MRQNSGKIVPRAVQGVQGVSGSFMEFQGVSWSFREIKEFQGVQGVSGSFREFQGVSWSFTEFQGVQGARPRRACAAP